jgi:lysine-specific demethylase 3
MAKINGVLSCHPVLRKVVGCTELLSLKTLLEPDWVSKLTKDVENILGEHNTVCLDMDAASPDAKRHRSSNIQGADAAEFCLNHSTSKDLNVSSHNLVPSVASGGDAGKCSSLPPQGAKYTEIYCPHSRDLKGAAGMQQFQKHWQRGEPVRVKNSHTKATGLSWEPSIMLRAFQGTAINDIDKATYVVKALDCLDRHQVQHHLFCSCFY